jgi:hypothetical protein
LIGDVGGGVGGEEERSEEEKKVYFWALCASYVIIVCLAVSAAAAEWRVEERANDYYDKWQSAVAAQKLKDADKAER